MPSAADNAAKTRRYYEALWNQRDFSVIADWIAPGFVGHYSSLPEPVRGPDGLVLEEWANLDDLGMARQIKALPEAGTREERVGQVMHRLRTRRLRKQPRS
jgi:hypothetical protein